MRSLSSMLRTLLSSQYLSTSTIDIERNIIVGDLLHLGQLYREQITKHWQRQKTFKNPKTTATTYNEVKIVKASQESLSLFNFIETVNFREQCEQISVQPTSPIVFKAIYQSKQPPSKQLDASASDKENRSTIQYISQPENARDYLVTDMFIPRSAVLERYHNMQRERKIWWMRFSANPSRYLLQPYVPTTKSNGKSNDYSDLCQSMSIGARFPFGVARMEDITLVPLDQMQGVDSRHGASVIRSVIDLEAATFAMLLDGCDHNRNDTLFLNRKLVPLQCAIFISRHTTSGAELDNNDNVFADLCDLSKHLNYVLDDAGLRIQCNDSATLFHNLIEEFRKADYIGIPYLLIIDAETLRTGLLRLRSRDTKLNEIIHISDVPHYLLNIFNC